MKRRKNKEKKVIHRKYYLYLPLTIITVFLLGYMGKMTVELITRADFTDNNLLSKIFSENENLTKSQTETKTENKEIDDNDKLVEETENKELIINEEGSESKSDEEKVSSDKDNLKKAAVTIVLEELFNKGESYKGGNWEYVHDTATGSGEIRLDHTGDVEITLQNNKDGDMAEIPLPIIIRSNVIYGDFENLTLKLNNINIKRPERIYSNDQKVNILDTGVISLYNVIPSSTPIITVELVEGTTNRIDAKDNLAGIGAQRSAIYFHSGVSDGGGFNVTGDGKLICNDGGINIGRDITAGESSLINISGGDIEINAVGTNRSGIGAFLNDNDLDKFAVNIEKGDNNKAPKLLVTATSGQAIRENGSSVEADIMLNHLDLGENRTGENWIDWNDDVEKTLQIVKGNDKSIFHEVTIPGGVQSVVYTLPGISETTDTNVKVSFTNDGENINSNFINAETGNKIITATNDLKTISVILDRILPALRTLYEGGSTGGGTWNYTTDGTGGTLRLTDTDDFVLKNLEDGGVDTEGIPIHIIVEEGANNSNITLNNINISRPTRLNSSGNYLAVENEANAPIFIEAENITITLAENTTNYIDAEDGSAGVSSQRSAIYLYAGTAEKEYTLIMTGSGKLICEDAGINTYATETAASNIVIKNGDIIININNKSYRTGIGSVCLDGINFGSLNIRIIGGKVAVNCIGSLLAASIGTSAVPNKGTIDNLAVVISGKSSVLVNHSDSGNVTSVYGTLIGSGYRSFTNSLLIEIVDNPVVEVKQVVNASVGINMYGALIGTGGMTKYSDATINFKGGQVKVLQIINSDNPIRTSPIIGQGANASDSSNTMNININGDVIISASGYEGIGFNGNVVGGSIRGPVKVNISRDSDGNVPNLLITVQNEKSIVEMGGTGTTTNVMIGHLDFGENRTGNDWSNWNDDVEKTLQIVTSDNKSVLREVTIPGNVRRVAYTLPDVSTATDTNVKVSFTNDGNNISGNFITSETRNKIITATNELKAISVIFDRLLPALRTLYEDGSTIGSTWNYVHAETGGTLYLTGKDDFVLKNLEDGGVDTEGIPIHIIVEAGANNANITLNNVNITRPTRLNSNVEYLAVEDKANAPIFIGAENTTIILAENTTNYIDATDMLAGTESQRSAIYVYAGTAGKEYTLNMTGSGKLICEDAGINTYVESISNFNIAISNIIIKNGDIMININNKRNRTGIGSISADRLLLGNLNIEILNGKITVNVNSTSGIYAAGIGLGSGKSGGVIIKLTIKISGTSSVLVKMNVQAQDSQTAVISGSGIGSGNFGVSNNTIRSLLIDIADNPTVEVKQSVTSTGTCYLRAAAIGTGRSGQRPDITINLNGGQVKVSQTINSSSTFIGASIGESYGLFANNADGNTMNINIGGNVTLDVNGYKGIGGGDNTTDGTVKVNISKDDDGNVPNILITTQNGQAIVERNGTGTIGDGVMLSHLDLGIDRSGNDWGNWNDDVEKTLQIVNTNDSSSLREVTISGNVQSVVYTLPENISTSTDTNVKVSFTNNGKNINRNFINAETRNKTITASNDFKIVSVIFDILLPALRTLYEGGSTSGSTWNYIHDETGGTLYLTGTDDFVLQNLKDGSVDTESFPIHIIVEKEASGSNITFNNLNIKRAELAESKTPVLNADSELIAPFMIDDASTVNIILAEESNNTIDGQDLLLENTGYRTAIYMHAPTASTYTLKIGRENPESSAPAPRLTTLNGGINALGVENTNINMQLKDGNYDLNALNNKYEHAIALGSGYAEENINAGNYNLVFETVNENGPTTVRALGSDVAIGHNGNLSTSTTSVKGKINLEAIAFTDGNAISGKFDHSALSFTTTLNKADDWESIVMHPYSGDELITNNFWELGLPETSSYPNALNQNITIVYSNPEIDTVKGASLFERMAMRIYNDKGTRFLANTDGTGSTTPIISPNNEISSRGNMLPTSTDFEINIPKITLETDLLERTFTTPNGEVRNVTNNSALPLGLAFAGSTLDNAPTGVDVDNFATSREDFANGTETAKILLELNIDKANNSGDINFDDEQAQTLIPRSSTPEAEDYVNIATLRGAHDNKISAVDLSVTGMFTEAASKNINGNFTNTVHLKFSLLDFAEFK